MPNQSAMLRAALQATEEACQRQVASIRAELQAERDSKAKVRRELQEARAVSTTLRMQLAALRRRMTRGLKELETLQAEREQLQDDLALEAGRAVQLDEATKDLTSQLAHAREQARSSEADRRLAASKAAVLEHQV